MVCMRANRYGKMENIILGVVLAYPALYLFPAWSPSRLLSLFDPLLPAAVLETCMRAYVV